MNVIYSPTAGILVSAPPSGPAPDIYYLADRHEWSDLEGLYTLSAIQDWQVVNSDDADLRSVIQSCTSDYWLSRVQSLIICLIEGVSDPLALEVLERVEEALQAHCSVDGVLGRLLVAPLRDSRRVEALAALALSNGFSAVAALLDRLADLQPLLRRFVARWLELPATEFVDLPVSREEFWQRLTGDSLLTRLLQAADHAAFSSTWLGLARVESAVVGRRAILHLGNLLARVLFPTSVRRDRGVEHARDDDRIADELEQTSHREGFSGHAAYQRALKQVNAIAQAVAEGKDGTASRYLTQLIADQVQSSTREQLVKSLCNIAQKCACMFRADFERQCLDRAMSIDSDDAWTLTQMGNHLKRVGEFEEAIKVLERAATGHASVAMSSIADVWCEKGDYSKAAEVYEGIPGWRDIVQVCTGLADIKRHTGKLSEALSEYEEILREWQWPGTDRAMAGKAEIFKQWGRFDEAIAIYDSLIYSPAIEESNALVYRLAKCAVLKQANRLTDAYKLADDVVRATPFCMSARIQRSSLLALLGKEAEALASIPQGSVPPAFGTWITQYYRGLLLLKLERYQEAKELLVDRFESASLASDNRAILRLGAAFALLCLNDFGLAAAALSEIGNVRDYYTEFVRHVLELHLCVVREDQERAAEIARQLRGAWESDETVMKVVDALQQKDFATAKRYELELLLRVAA